MRKREPCSVDIWSYKVVQKSSKTQIEANKPHVFRVYTIVKVSQSPKA